MNEILAMLDIIESETGSGIKNLLEDCDMEYILC